MAFPRQSAEEDWERINAKSWELPNYGPSPGFDPGKRYTRRQADEYPESRVLDFDDDYVPEEINHIRSASSPIKDTTSRSTSSGRPLPTSSRTTSTDTSNTHGKSRSRSQNGRKPPSSSLPASRARPIILKQNDLPSKAKWRNGSRPDGKCVHHVHDSAANNFLACFRLPYECRIFQNKIRGQTQADASSIDFRQTIIEDTGAYVRMSDGDPKASPQHNLPLSERCTILTTLKVVEIWGQDTEVSAARRQLQEMVANMIQLRNSFGVPRWDKIRAHSLAKDANAQSREYYETRLSSLRKPPKISTFYTLAFLWPSDGPSVDYSLSARRELVDGIRLKYTVNIYIKSGVSDYIYVSGNSQRDMIAIASQFRELCRSLMVQSETEYRLLLVGPPPVELMRTHIILQKSGQFSRAVLCGPELAPEVAANWRNTANALKVSNKDAVTSRLRHALRVIPQFQGFLQMRAKFGSFALQQWRKPDDGTSFRFSEFREVISLMNTEGRLLPGIRVQQEKMFSRIIRSDILRPYGQAKIGSLLRLIPTYSANFEYKASRDTMIRVEAKFSLPLGSQEFEVNGIRCFKPQEIDARIDCQMPMQISMIDFERSDWQFEIKALQLCGESDVSPELERFKRSIAFQWNSSAKSLGSAPQRKSKFAHGSKVTRFVEKAAVQLQVKDTPYVFEISRFDEYKYAAGHWSTTPNVFWGASLFDPAWDDLLGEQAESDVHKISKDGSLNLFFPSPEDDNKQKGKEQTDEAQERAGTTEQDDKQLRKFMSTVQQIARMLGDPGADMPAMLDCDLGTLF
ncbi:hypothetical protein N7457_000694 [Penicillium paradoxum]|uniref:uncharacterized protein n=1 Tax=Penicillium paradoxum TaxID=176176 RepID=UPI002548C649|nr:uncharacterized protein N7457_000694 [Penicillium paradoxum]KAJ5794095.1 hypothetical protein N7457_000694 [Penicillium paradoxum]